MLSQLKCLVFAYRNKLRWKVKFYVKMVKSKPEVVKDLHEF